MSRLEQGKVLIIAGPTASGKSDLAVDVAEEFSGIVINADSMQIYSGLEVISAAPSAAAHARAPHKLYGVRDPANPCSAGEWAALAKQEIVIAHDEGRLPIVVGGTGMYLKTLISGIASMPSVPSHIREGVRERLAQEGCAALHDILANIDADSAARIHVSDGQRIARAIEIFEATGKTLTVWQKSGSNEGAGYDFKAVLLEPSREVLYAACNRRFDEMLANGALEEVRALVKRNLSTGLPAMRALGIPILIRYLAGEMTMEQACKAGQQATRNYVKRQETWFRNQFVADLTEKSKYNNKLMPSIFSFVSKFMLT